MHNVTFLLIDFLNYQEMGRYSEGTESYPQFAVRIAQMLKDRQKFQELFPYLQKVGFQPT